MPEKVGVWFKHSKNTKLQPKFINKWGGGKLGPGWMRREGGSGRRWGRANHDQNTSYKSYFQFNKLDESRGFHRKWRHPDSKGSSETIIFNLSSRMVRNQIQFPRQRENFLNTHTHTRVHIHAWIYMHLHTHINNSDRFFFLIIILLTIQYGKHFYNTSTISGVISNLDMLLRTQKARPRLQAIIILLYTWNHERLSTWVSLRIPENKVLSAWFFVIECARECMSLCACVCAHGAYTCLILDVIP